MLILINDNNIFIIGFERNTFNYGVIMGMVEHILVKNYSIPSMHIGGYLNGETVNGISCGHLFGPNGLLTLVINAEITRVLPLLQQNAVNADIVKIVINIGFVVYFELNRVNKNIIKRVKTTVTDKK